MLPTSSAPERIGEFWSYPAEPHLAELLIDCEEDRTLRAVLVGMLREADSSGPGDSASSTALPGPRLGPA
jgi:hypothetical protein